MNEDVHSLLGPYAVGALDDAEREAFERHLDACADCREDVASFGEVTASLAEAEAVAPPVELRARVMDAAARTPQLPPIVGDLPDAGEAGPRLAPLGRQGHPSALDSQPDASVTPLSRPVRGMADETSDAVDPNQESRPREHARARRSRSLLVAAASVLALAAVGLGWGLSQDDPGDSLAMEREVMMIASAPDAHSMDLDLGSTHIVVSDRMEAFAVMGTSTPMPDKGMEYQLWLVMEDGTKVAGPTFMPGDDGEVMTMMHVDLAGAMAIGVTIEPEGGSAAPTSEVIAEVAL
ncbi:anti-sigma factor [Demequina sp. NBRC 110052]|uniref:anti-sigma factor n=1 Tax=Demequina sp. NBRC 110052 TaxID=1570341 RepID=UPI0013564B9A|nr:anti-sigma factor [Demequina sp. NBRC 110052]